jgi:hypothetical protein
MKRRDGGTVKGLGRGEYRISLDGTVEEAIDTRSIEQAISMSGSIAAPALFGIMKIL